MQFDHNSERVTFDLPRYVEGHDMMDCNKVEVHYKNIETKTNKVNLGIYAVDDMKVDDNNENTVVFSWLISINGTKLIGPLNFLVRFSCVADDGTVDYAWHTKLYTGILVPEGMCNIEEIEETYADVLEQWMSEAETSIENGINAALAQAKESGVFDGEPGKDGYTPVKGVDYFDGVDGKDGKDGHDGYTPIKGVDYFDGVDGQDGAKGDKGDPFTYADFTPEQLASLKGEKGDDGKTPEKGTDYYTESDKAEMVNAVIAALPTWEGGSY
jgi:hypothetical protein